MMNKQRCFGLWVKYNRFFLRFSLLFEHGSDVVVLKHELLATHTHTRTHIAIENWRKHLFTIDKKKIVTKTMAFDFWFGAKISEISRCWWNYFNWNWNQYDALERFHFIWAISFDSNLRFVAFERMSRFSISTFQVVLCVTLPSCHSLFLIATIILARNRK